MRKIVICCMAFNMIHADVTLVNVINRTNSELDIFIVGPLSSNKSLTGTSKVHLAPHDEKMGLNIDLVSKKNPKSSSIRIPTHNNYQYSPSGDTPVIDLVIESNNIRVIPSGSLARDRKSKPLGHDWIFDKIFVKSIDNKSPYLADVRSGLKQYEQMPVFGRIIECLPGKKYDNPYLPLVKGQELVIYVTTKDGTFKRAEYLPTGKAETLEVIIDEQGKVFIHEHRQSLVAVPFQDIK